MMQRNLTNKIHAYIFLQRLYAHLLVLKYISFTYNTDFRVSSETVNGANTVSFTYDNDGLLTGAGALSLTRNATNGLITGSTLGTATTTQGYNNFGEMSQFTASVSGSSMFNIQYTRDALGRITQKVETAYGVPNTYAYTYDTAGRLTDVALNGSNVRHYVYDSNSNRISLNTVTAVYDNQDRLLMYGNNSYTYTTNGELQSKTNASGTTTYVYDVLGNLLSSTFPNGTAIEYVIDGQNRRIGKKVNGVLTQGFLYENQLRPVAELDGTGAIVSRFVYGTKINVPEYMIKNGTIYRIITDHLGSPRFVINTSSGSITQELDYDEFGNIIFDTNPAFQPFGFAGGIYDQHTKLTRFGARDYDAETGRWTAKDPIGFKGGMNFYSYVNDPVNWIDPLGLISEAIVPQNVIQNVQNIVNNITNYHFPQNELDILTTLTIEAIKPWEIFKALDFGMIDPYKLPLELTESQNKFVENLLERMRKNKKLSDEAHRLIIEAEEKFKEAKKWKRCIIK